MEFGALRALMSLKNAVDISQMTEQQMDWDLETSDKLK